MLLWDSLLAIVILFSIGGSARAENEQLDWSTWRHLPTFGEGRVAPLDTFARETVEAICGRANPTLRGPDAPSDGTPREFTAAELLFAWLVEPEKWEPFGSCRPSESLREYLGLPLADADGRRLRGVSPFEVENSDSLARRLADLRQRADAEGKEFRPTDAEKELDSLLDAYDKYRALTFNPNVAAQRAAVVERLAGGRLPTLCRS